MKKLIIPAVLAAILLTASCGKDKTAAPSVRPSGSPAASAAATSAPKGIQPTASGAAPNESSNASEASDKASGDTDALTEDNGGSAADEANAAGDENEADNNGNTGHSDSISIINGSSVPFYAVYLSTSSDGNPGENIIGDTPFGEGEEIVLPFANAPEEELNIIVEDENGVRYSAGGISLANGLSIELRLNNGSLEAVVQ